MRNDMQFERGARVRYCAKPGTERFDPLHQLTGTVTHFNGDDDGKYKNGGTSAVWVTWDQYAPCWVFPEYLSLLS